MTTQQVAKQMHGQSAPVKLSITTPQRRGRRWPWLLAIIVLAGAGYETHRRYPELASGLLSRTKPAVVRQGSRTVPVVVAKVRQGDLPIYLDGLGTATALNTVTVRSRVDGEIIKLAFVEGSMVHQGDLLAEIDPRPYQVQLAQAQGQLAKDEAALNFSKLDLARYESAPKNIVTQQQRDTAIAQVGQNEGLVKSDQAQIQAIQLQLTYCRIIAPISGRVGLRIVDQGNLVRANDPSGLAVITQLEPISVVFSLSEDVLPQILKAKASGAPLSVQAQNRDKTVTLATGSLLAIDNQVDSATLMIKLKAVFENQQHTLFPNQAVNIRLLVDTRKNVLLIPAAAVQHRPDASTFVYVVQVETASQTGQRSGSHDRAQKSTEGKPQSRPAAAYGEDAAPRLEGTVALRTITVGPSEGDLVVIESGLKADEIVVTDGVDKLQPGSTVSAQLAPPVATQKAAPTTQPETISAHRPTTRRSR